MKLRVKNTLLIGVAFLSITVLWQAYNWLVPMYLDGYLRGVFGGNEFLIGLVMGADNLFAVFMIPWIGKISDRQKRETGSRMKLIVGGLVFAGISSREMLSKRAEPSHFVSIAPRLTVVA